MKPPSIEPDLIEKCHCTCRAKLEISKEEAFNPIKQDVKVRNLLSSHSQMQFVIFEQTIHSYIAMLSSQNGKLRFVEYGDGYMWNYGAFPQVRSSLLPIILSHLLTTAVAADLHRVARARPGRTPRTSTPTLMPSATRTRSTSARSAAPSPRPVTSSRSRCSAPWLSSTRVRAR